MASERKSRGLRLLGVLSVLFVILVGAVNGPRVAMWWRFRESSTRGLTPDELIVRCGPPLYGAARGADAYDGTLPFGGWHSMSVADRQTLCGREEFVLGWEGAMGNVAIVTFKSGRATDVRFASK